MNTFRGHGGEPAHGEHGDRWAGRRRARAAALQALYECEVGGLTPQQALGVLHHAGPPEVADPGADEHAFVIALVRGAMEQKDALDERIGDAAKNWRVVISEAIELARAYSGEDAAKFVNGVLDGAYRRLKEEGIVVE